MKLIIIFACPQIAGKTKLEVILKVTHLKRVESEPPRNAAVAAAALCERGHVFNEA